MLLQVTKQFDSADQPDSPITERRHNIWIAIQHWQVSVSMGKHICIGFYCLSVPWIVPKLWSVIYWHLQMINIAMHIVFDRFCRKLMSNHLRSLSSLMTNRRVVSSVSHWKWMFMNPAQVWNMARSRFCQIGKNSRILARVVVKFQYSPILKFVVYRFCIFFDKFWGGGSKTSLSSFWRPVLWLACVIRFVCVCLSVWIPQNVINKA